MQHDSSEDALAFLVFCMYTSVRCCSQAGITAGRQKANYLSAISTVYKKYTDWKEDGRYMVYKYKHPRKTIN